MWFVLFASDRENLKLRTSKSAVGPRRKAAGAEGVKAAAQTRKGLLRAAKTSGDVKAKPSQEEETYRVRSGQITCKLSGFLLSEHNMNNKKLFFSLINSSISVWCLDQCCIN